MKGDRRDLKGIEWTFRRIERMLDRIEANIATKDDIARIESTMATKADCDRIVERIQQLMALIPESIVSAGNPLDGRTKPP